MTTLNRDWADVLRAFRPNAVTDVTGFGLLGHSFEMADRSGVQLVLESPAWPALDGALEAARAGERTGGDRRNREFAEAHVRAEGVPPELLALGWDPQTAGSHRLAPRPRRGRARADSAHDLFVRRIGRVEAGAGVVFSGTDPSGVCPCETPHSTPWSHRPLRSFGLSATTFRRLAGLCVFALWLIISTGAVVRLTRSGLGCEHWPGCEPGTVPGRTTTPMSSSKRLVGGDDLPDARLAVGAWFTRAPRWVRWLAVGVFAGRLRRRRSARSAAPTCATLVIAPASLVAVSGGDLWRSGVRTRA
jgi:hypothetical protein